MRFWYLIALASVMIACDENRVFEKNNDFTSEGWQLKDSVSFDFDITDASYKYNLYCNVRNSVDYPYSRFFVRYALKDSTGKNIAKNLTEVLLFDKKTGKPFGESGLGDLYDQRVSILSNYSFPYAGKYSVKFQQEMRKDTIEGILAIGLRVERSGR